MSARCGIGALGSRLCVGIRVLGMEFGRLSRDRQAERLRAGMGIGSVATGMRFGRVCSVGLLAVAADGVFLEKCVKKETLLGRADGVGRRCLEPMPAEDID